MKASKVELKCKCAVNKKDMLRQINEAIKMKGPKQILCTKKGCKHVLSDQEIISIEGLDLYKDYISSYQVTLCCIITVE